MGTELPRALDIREFVNAREPELKALLQALKEFSGPDRFGYASLPRHLRRRATSHRRFVCKRRPNIPLAPKKQRLGTGDVSQQHHATAGQAGDAVRPTNRAMRRRPALLRASFAQQSRVACEQQQGGQSDPTSQALAAAAAMDVDRASAAGAAPSQVLSARAPGSDVADAAAVPAAAAAAAGEGTAAAASASTRQQQAPSRAVHRLETHVWHTRRMKMHHLWGHVLPLQAPGRGHGSRSLLHVLRGGAVMHDASYWHCLQLAGPQKGIVAMLKAVSDSVQLDEALQRSEVFCGAAEWPLMLHAPAPARAGGGAPGGSILGPARALWIPPHQQEEVNAAGGGGSGQPQQQAGTTEVSMVTGAGDVDEEGWYPWCGLWLWVHAAAAADVQAALQQAQQQLLQALDAAAVAAVVVGSCPGRLVRLEVVGGGCDAALQRVLQSAQQQGADSAGHQIWQSVNQTGSICQPAWRWPEDSVVGLNVVDPRVSRPVKAGSHTLQALWEQAQGPQPALQGGQLQRALKQWPESGDWTDGAHALLHGCMPSSSGSGSGSCSSAAAVPPPLSDALVGAIRSAARCRWLRINAPRCSEQQALAALLAAASSAAGADGSQQQQQHVVEAARWSASCPVLLVRRCHGSAALPGWSLILPAGWAQPFWTALAFAGARTAGQLEWRWVASQAGAPLFPYDFPHTPAAARLTQQLQAQLAAFAARRPRGKVPKLPGLPYIPWHRLLAMSSPAVPVGAGLPTGSSKQRQRSGGNAAQAGNKPTTQGAGTSVGGFDAEATLAGPEWRMCHTSEQAASGSAAAGTKGPRAVSRALQAGQLQWVPKQVAPAVSSSPASASAGTPAQAGVIDAPDQHQQGRSTAQAWLWVKVLGPGVCEEGAEVCVDAGQLLPVFPSSIGSAGAAAAAPEPARPLIVGYVTSAAPRGVSSVHSSTFGLATTAARAAAGTPSAAVAGATAAAAAGGGGPRAAAGALTSSTPSALSQSSSSAGAQALHPALPARPPDNGGGVLGGYPGGLAVCDLATVLASRARQWSSRLGSRAAGGALCSGRGDGEGGAGAGSDQRVFVVWLRSPGSACYRRALACLAHELASGAAWM